MVVTGVGIVSPLGVGAAHAWHQLLDGRTVSFRNVVLIITSNLGTRSLGRGVNLGFRSEGDASGAEAAKSRVLEEVKKTFNPEFINRLDEIVVRAKSTDINVSITGLAWLPYTADDKGRLRPAW